MPLNPQEIGRSASERGIDPLTIYPHDVESVMYGLDQIHQRLTRIALIKVPGELAWLKSHPTRKLEHALDKISEALHWLRLHSDQVEAENARAIDMYVTTGFPLPNIVHLSPKENHHAPNQDL